MREFEERDERDGHDERDEHDEREHLEGPGEPWVRPSRGAHLALAAVLVVTGGVLAVMGLTNGKTPPAAPMAAVGARSAPVAAPRQVPAAVDLVAGLPYAEPTGLTVPTIGVHAPVVDTGQAADGSPQVPPFAHPEQVGWYTSTASPGERGAAVLWGHLDTRTGSAVFQNLSALTVGDSVQVARADGRVATFTVERTAVYPRDEFPADTVYDDPGYPALRLVTCGGQFDRKTQEYTSNIVVFARLTSVTAPLAAVEHPAPVNIEPQQPMPTMTPGRHPAHPKAKPLPQVPAPAGPSGPATTPAPPKPTPTEAPTPNPTH